MNELKQSKVGEIVDGKVQLADGWCAIDAYMRVPPDGELRTHLETILRYVPRGVADPVTRAMAVCRLTKHLPSDITTKGRHGHELRLDFGSGRKHSARLWVTQFGYQLHVYPVPNRRAQWGYEMQDAEMAVKILNEWLGEPEVRSAADRESELANVEKMTRAAIEHSDTAFLDFIMTLCKELPVRPVVIRYLSTYPLVDLMYRFGPHKVIHLTAYDNNFDWEYNEAVINNDRWDAECTHDPWCHHWTDQRHIGGIDVKQIIRHFNEFAKSDPPAESTVATVTDGVAEMAIVD